jgi:hypothetical protein
VDLSEELWLWGEDELHLRPLQMSDAELVSLYRLAATIYFSQRKARTASEACALAAVALLGGHERPLARKRRRSAFDTAQTRGIARSASRRNRSDRQRARPLLARRRPSAKWLELGDHQPSTARELIDTFEGGDETRFAER